MTQTELAGLIEGILFSYGDGLSASEISEITGAKLAEVSEAIDMLETDMQQVSRGIFLIRFEDKVQLGAKPFIYPYMKKIFVEENSKGLSSAALEVLSIVAYKQPVTKIDIDQIRGVKCDNTLKRLNDMGLVCTCGRLERIGKPFLYKTTDEFLKRFGLRSIEDLPKPSEVVDEDGQL